MWVQILWARDLALPNCPSERTRALHEKRRRRIAFARRSCVRVRFATVQKMCTRESSRACDGHFNRDARPTFR
jgi:hypothetical protein